MPRKKAVDQALDFGPDHFRHIFGKKDMEAGVLQIESHRTERIWKGVGLGGKNARITAVWLAADDDGSGSVAKQNRRDEVGLGDILALKGKRRQFHRDYQDIGA